MRKPPGIFKARTLREHVLDQVTAGPSMFSTLLGMFRRIELARVVKEVVDFEIREIEQLVVTRGVVIPFPAQMLRMLPEGQRAWDWQTLYTHRDFVIAPDDVLVYRGTRYRVMEKNSYTAYGIVKYTLANDYAKQ